MYTSFFKLPRVCTDYSYCTVYPELISQIGYGDGDQLAFVSHSYNILEEKQSSLIILYQILPFSKNDYNTENNLKSESYLSNLPNILINCIIR